MGLGQLRGGSWLTNPPRNCPNQISIVAHDGSYVNGFRSGLVAMKKVGTVLEGHLSRTSKLWQLLRQRKTQWDNDACYPRRTLFDTLPAVGFIADPLGRSLHRV